MNFELLRKHIEAYRSDYSKDSSTLSKELKERQGLVTYYSEYSRDRIMRMTAEDIYEYVSPLWAMLIWGNKHYVVDKILEDNGIDAFREHLSELVWGKSSLGDRWDTFRKGIKGMGPAMISEILCKSHPNECMLWNRRAYVGLNYLEVDGLPRYDYQLTGAVYERLCKTSASMSEELKAAGFEDTTLLAVDYFIWQELQVEDNLSKIHKKKAAVPSPTIEPDKDPTGFVHDEIRDKLRDIGIWLGFDGSTEKKVSEGARVDTIWEATIGNMGRVIYVFEVQTKGSIDSLIVNLLKSLNNSAVQGVVAVSDPKQLERIRKHAEDVKELRDKLKYWNYEDVLRVHESLEYVNESINALGLVPQGF